MKIEEGLPDNPGDESVEVRVARGARLLDEQGPQGWRTKVTAELVMWSDTHCVLGQVYGRYSAGIRALGLTTVTSAQRYGFFPTNHAGDPPDLTLKLAWLAELERDQATV